MNEGKIFLHLQAVKDEKGGVFFLLIDPDRTPEKKYLTLTEAAGQCGVDAILVGSSFMLASGFSLAVSLIKESTSLPVIIFPGSFTQVVPGADAILFTSLISGRNPNYLIEEQVRGAPLVKQFGLEVIPAGYMLIDSGMATSVQYISNTQPIPRDKYEIAGAHALAAQYLGMKMVYLEAGSGAKLPVPEPMVRSIASYADIPLIVGGGLTRPEQCSSMIKAGASFVVIGSVIENDPRFTLLSELTEATHPKKVIMV